MNLPRILALALTACKAVIETSIRAGIDPGSATVCYKWIADWYKAQGVAPLHLKELAKLGYLIKAGSVRGGHRAYYRLNLSMAV
jgi:hypothetical protein